MNRKELNRIGQVLNCKGTGKPGPCKIGKAYFIRAADHESGKYVHDTDEGERGPAGKSPFSHFGEAKPGGKRVYVGPQKKK